MNRTVILKVNKHRVHLGHLTKKKKRFLEATILVNPFGLRPRNLNFYKMILVCRLFCSTYHIMSFPLFVRIGWSIWTTRKASQDDHHDEQVIVERWEMAWHKNDHMSNLKCRDLELDFPHLSHFFPSSMHCPGNCQKTKYCLFTEL